MDQEERKRFFDIVRRAEVGYARAEADRINELRNLDTVVAWADVKGIIDRQTAGLDWKIIDSELPALLEIIEASDRNIG